MQIRTLLMSSDIKVKHLTLNQFTCDELKQGILNQIADWDIQCPELRVLIWDGYDERSGSGDYNYFTTNKLSEYENLKVVITSRSETLRSGYHSNFMPHNGEAFEEWKLHNFTNSQIREMMLLHTHGNAVEAEVYLSKIDHQPELREMVKNPLLLEMISTSLTELSKDLRKLTRYRIYEVANEKRFLNRVQYLASTGGVERGVDILQDFKINSAKLALNFHKEGVNVIKYVQPKKCKKREKRKGWDKIFDVRDDQGRYDQIAHNNLRSFPIIINELDNSYQFIHLSMKEFYFVEGLRWILSHKPKRILKLLKKYLITTQTLVENFGEKHFKSILISNLNYLV
jgi:DNA replication protein DnaD